MPAPPLLYADITFDMVTVGNPGNAADDTGHGSVSYVYQVGKYEVTVAQYAAFLNAKAATDYYGLYSESMQTDPLGSIIIRSGDSGSYTYSVVAGKENQPIRWVSLYDAMRFCNWLHNGQGDGDTESGSYDMRLGLFADRQAGATWVVTSEDEWYKAAYYDPENECYYDYPNGTDEVPEEPTDGTTPRVMNFGDDPYWAPEGEREYFTSTGETTGYSAYGVYDMGGNVQEWTDTMDAPYLQYRVVRGGYYEVSEEELRASVNTAYHPDQEGYTGIRLAYLIPEPGTIGLALLGFLAVWRHRKRYASRA